MIPGQADASTKDCELLKLVQLGDQPALVTLYDRYSKLAYSVSLKVLKDPVSAEDVLQELFMQLWRRPEHVSLRGETLHGWFIISSRNRSISLLRKKYPGPLDDVIVASPFDLERNSERRLMCERLLNALNPEQRVVLEMAYLNEMSQSEIALATGYPLGTIKTRIRSALKVLRKAWVSPFERVPDLATPLVAPISPSVIAL